MRHNGIGLAHEVIVEQRWRWLILLFRWTIPRPPAVGGPGRGLPWQVDVSQCHTSFGSKTGLRASPSMTSSTPQGASRTRRCSCAHASRPSTSVNRGTLARSRRMERGSVPQNVRPPFRNSFQAGLSKQVVGKHCCYVITLNNLACTCPQSEIKS